MSRKLKETKVGAWLRNHAPDLLATLGDLVPDAGLLDFVASRLERGGYTTDEKQAAEVHRLLIEERATMANDVSRRWEADAKSDGTLAKLVRPICLLVTLAGFFGVLIADSIVGNGFELDPYLAEVLEVMALTIFGAYFAGRSIEKTVRR